LRVAHRLRRNGPVPAWGEERGRGAADVCLGFPASLQQSVGSDDRSWSELRQEQVSLLSEHIVIVDDDALLRGRLAAYLTSEGYRVTTADSAATFRSIMRRERIDLVLVDITMPGEDGLSLTRFLREQSEIGVVILTGKGDPIERAIGLEVGADDYVAKPFHLRELLARVRSVLRRTKTRPDRDAGPVAPVVRFAGWRLDLAKRTLTSARGEAVPLTTAEYQLLEAFVANPNQVLGRERLLQLVVGRKWQPYDRTIDQHISRVRRKIERDPKQPELIKSIRGQGYLFAAQVERDR
jgi:two-component system, OmpR family, response regulator